MADGRHGRQNYLRFRYDFWDIWDIFRAGVRAKTIEKPSSRTPKADHTHVQRKPAGTSGPRRRRRGRRRIACMPRSATRFSRAPRSPACWPAQAAGRRAASPPVSPCCSDAARRRGRSSRSRLPTRRRATCEFGFDALTRVPAPRTSRERRRRRPPACCSGTVWARFTRCACIF